MLGPVMSASSRPTVAPAWASATARLTLTVLLPTPPLPDATAMTFFTSGSICSALARRRAADHRSPGDLDAGRADPDEGGPRVALDLVLERAGRRRQLDREGDAVVPSITTSLTMLRVTMSRPSSGSWTVRRASKMAPSERVMRLVGPRRRVAVPNIDGDCVDMANPSAIGRRGPRCEPDGDRPDGRSCEFEPLHRDCSARISNRARRCGRAPRLVDTPRRRHLFSAHRSATRRRWAQGVANDSDSNPDARPAGRGRVPREKS